MRFWLVVGLLSSIANAQEASPPIPPDGPIPSVPVEGPVDIKAVVVRSWNSGTASAWGELNAEWPLYGSQSIMVDSTTLGGVSSFTYQDLVNSGADVIIIGNPSGGTQVYSPAEVSALMQYAGEGHNVIGTYLTLYWSMDPQVFDNRALAPLFGLRPDIDYTVVPISNQFNKLDESTTLFESIPGSSWQSQGYPNSQCPANDMTWDPGDLNGARIIAESDSSAAILTLYDGNNYTGIFISNMPEFHGETLDKQLLYNAITYDRNRVVPTLHGGMLMLLAALMLASGVVWSIHRSRDKKPL